MYSLDINFLRDRGLDQSADSGISLAQKRQPSMADKIPIAAGVIMALVFPAMTFGYLKTVTAQTATTEQEIQQLESEIADLGNQNKKLEAAEAEIEKAEAEIGALVGVFEKIRPWAAILQEVSDRTPLGVQVDSIQQIEEEGAISINLAGIARSYDDVNDFVLFLQRSPFFEANNIKLNGATTTEVELEVENEKDLPINASLVVPSGIKYDISAQLNNVPSSQLIQEIDQKGSVGLVTRLKTLERTGASLK
jgi:type IV pilus assembly protein PilN